MTAWKISMECLDAALALAYIGRGPPGHGLLGLAVLGAAEIVRAARSGDSAILLDRVNLPALRRSLARQIAQAYLKATGKADKMGALGRSVAGAAATTIADPYLAELLTPDNLVALLGQGRINSVKIGDKDLAVDRDLPGFSSLFNANLLWLVTGSYFDALNGFVIPVETGRGDANTGQVESYDVHLRLDGTTWRLSGIDLPSDLVDQMAHSIMTGNKPELP